MVLVNCVGLQDEIIEQVEAIEYKGIQIFKHVKTEGMRMFFDSKIADEVRNIQKSAIMEYMLIMDAIMRIHRWDTYAISILPVVNDNVIDGYRYTVCGSSEAMNDQKLLK